MDGRCCFFFFFKQKTAYEMRISDWSSDVCSSDLLLALIFRQELLRLVTQPRGLVELGLDARGTGIELRGDGTIDRPARQNDERSEERRVGKECVRKFRSRWTAYPEKKNNEHSHNNPVPSANLTPTSMYHRL